MTHRRSERPGGEQGRGGKGRAPIRKPGGKSDVRRERSRGEGPRVSSRPAPKPVNLPEDAPVVQLRSAHYDAFIYSRMIDDVRGEPADGDLVAVLDKWGQFFGWGFYHGSSQITLRMFSRERDKPGEEEIHRRVAEAVGFRRDVLRLDESADACRLIHAEGDGLSGLIVDRFGEHVVIELFSLAMHRRLHAIQDAIVDAGISVKQFVVRVDKETAEREGIRLGRQERIREDRAVINENGVRFAVDLSHGHKTGFFCDQRDNRLALTRYTPGKRVLDVCSYTGGFAVYAAARGKAAEVTAVDLDERALAVADENARLNDAAVDLTHADGFDYLRAAAAEGRQWDVIVLDPPKFVPRRSLMDVGLRKYHDLNRLALEVLAPGGILLTCSCSGLVTPEVLLTTLSRASRAAGRPLQIFNQTGAAADHPIHTDSLQGQYLKAVWARGM